MITIENCELLRQGDQALLTFHEEDAPAALAQISQAALRALPPAESGQGDDDEQVVLVIEGQGPTGALVVAFGPMARAIASKLHRQARQLTVCALGPRAPAYMFVIELQA